MTRFRSRRSSSALRRLVFMVFSSAGGGLLGRISRSAVDFVDADFVVPTSAEGSIKPVEQLVKGFARPTNQGNQHLAAVGSDRCTCHRPYSAKSHFAVTADERVDVLPSGHTLLCHSSV
jgi:hypothetical protein